MQGDLDEHEPEPRTSKARLLALTVVFLIAVVLGVQLLAVILTARRQ